MTQIEQAMIEALAELDCSCEVCARTPQPCPATKSSMAEVIAILRLESKIKDQRIDQMAKLLDEVWHRSYRNAWGCKTPCHPQCVRCRWEKLKFNFATTPGASMPGK